MLRVPGALPFARLVIETIRVCMKYRVTGLASEAGFFMLLSLPPLVLGLFGGVGYVGSWLGRNIQTSLLDGIQRFAEQFLVGSIVDTTIVPTARDVLQNGRFDLISIGFVLSIWSGSRALNVFVDTISIMYGQSGVRGIVQTRALSLSLYFLSLVVGVLIVPLVVIGPTWLSGLLPQDLRFLALLYWPVVVLLTVASVTTLFHISTPRQTPWRRDIPGAALTLAIWVLASFVLRGTISASLGDQSTSIYGPLSTPIVLLIWLYALAIAILIGAALNAAIRKLYPVEERPTLRVQTMEWVKGKVAEARDNGTADENDARDRDDEAAVAARLDDAEHLLSTSMEGLRLEAHRPLTPLREEGEDPSEGERMTRVRADLETSRRIG
nr:YihY/virulence factor BrkB family protein [Knoellia sp. DB2414S]